MNTSVAFKCTYNDGGEGTFVGFADTCSLDNIARNVKNNEVPCGNEKHKCKRFYAGHMTSNKPVSPCMESRLFQAWEFGAGRFWHGSRKGQNKHLKHAKAGAFAILTTLFPGEPERDRRIIGLFQISSIKNNNTVIAAQHGRIRLPIEEAKELFFWKYCSTRIEKPIWGAGRFRYLDDGQIHRILEDVFATVQDQNTKSQIAFLIAQAFTGKTAPPASGCMPYKGKDRATALAKLRKYGSGGEGKDHKELKRWIFKHPEVLGLTDVVERKEEHVFRSGDAVDLHFKHKSGRHTVVEIETTTPLPGAHQAIKYRALMCAEKSLPLDSNRVQAILVAWEIPQIVRTFCSKYGLRVREYEIPRTTRRVAGYATE